MYTSVRSKELSRKAWQNGGCKAEAPAINIGILDDACEIAPASGARTRLRVQGLATFKFHSSVLHERGQDVYG